MRYIQPDDLFSKVAVDSVFFRNIFNGHPFACIAHYGLYLAVDIYAKHKTPIGIIFCIPVFILSGYEHSIADMFYFATSGIVSLKACGFIWTVILGNSIGGMLIPALGLVGSKKSEVGSQA